MNNVACMDCGVDILIMVIRDKRPLETLLTIPNKHNAVTRNLAFWRALAFSA